MCSKSLTIRLRRVTPDDAQFIDSWRNQASTMQFQASPRRSLAEIEFLLADGANEPISPQFSGRIGWMILSGHEPAGHIQLTINGDYDRRHHNAHLGYMVAEAFQNQGVATQAVDLVCSIGFTPDGLGLERIEAVAAAENVASRRVLEKAGFHFEGMRRKLLIINGERIDHASYARLAADY